MPEFLPGSLQSIHGKFNVRIRVTVDEAGNVSSTAFDSEGPSQYFAKTAMLAARKWKFKTAQAGGPAVPSAWILQFQFTRAGATVTPEPAH
jgi:TonB family protein